MNKFFKLTLLFVSIIVVILLYKNHSKRVKVNVSDYGKQKRILPKKL